MRREGGDALLTLTHHALCSISEDNMHTKKVVRVVIIAGLTWILSGLPTAYGAEPERKPSHERLLGQNWKLQFLEGVDSERFCHLSGKWKSDITLNLIASKNSVNIYLFSADWGIPEGSYGDIYFLYDDIVLKAMPFKRSGNNTITLFGNENIDLTVQAIALLAVSRKLQVNMYNGEALRASLASSKMAIIEWEKCANLWAGLPIRIATQSQVGAR